MKRILIVAALCIGLAACGGIRSDVVPARENGVEVLCFHGKQRCSTCEAIERETKAVIDAQFADAVTDGVLEMRIVDISRPENEALADKYEVSWTSLVVVKYTDGREQAENLTNFAFANARTNPEAFRAGLARKLQKMLE